MYPLSDFTTTEEEHMQCAPTGTIIDWIKSFLLTELISNPNTPEGLSLRLLRRGDIFVGVCFWADLD